MNPTDFPQSNHQLKKPDGMTDEQCSSLDIHVKLDENGNYSLVSCWVPSEEERKQIANGGPVWLTIVGVKHPPVMVSGLPPFPDPETKA